MKTLPRFCPWRTLAGQFTVTLALASFAPTIYAANLVTNGSFEANAGSFEIAGTNSPAGSGTVTGWTLGPTPGTTGRYPNPNAELDCLMSSVQTTGLCGPSNAGPGNTPWKFWVNPGPSPDGGNFVGVDGDPINSEALSTSVNLISGNTYTLTFYQAAAQQQGFNGATTEQWKVSLGGTTQGTQNSTLMSTAEHGDTPWNMVTMTFKATATGSEALSFLASGFPSGDTPFVLLDGVSLVQAASPTPEPATYALFTIGLLGVPIARRFRNKQ